MPCDSIRLVNVQLDKNTNPDMLMKALEELKLNPTREKDMIYFGSGESYNVKTGKMDALPYRDITEIKQALGAEIVKSQAKKYGWTLKPVANKKFTYAVTKR